MSLHYSQLFTDEGSHRLSRRLNYCFNVLARATNWLMWVYLATQVCIVLFHKETCFILHCTLCLCSRCGRTEDRQMTSLGAIDFMYFPLAWFGSGGIQNCILLRHLALICDNAGLLQLHWHVCLHACVFACTCVSHPHQCVYRLMTHCPLTSLKLAADTLETQILYICFVNWNPLYASIFKQKSIPVSLWFKHYIPINYHIRSHAQERIEAAALQHHRAVK